MGSIISNYKSDEDIQGYHILHIKENSPAHIAGLEAFFDFIIEVCDIKLNGSHEVLLLLLRQNFGKSIKMKIFSYRNNEYRCVNIIPNMDWGGNSLLGLTIRFCTLKESLDDVRHVLEVHSGSPAEAAGLHAYTDYIIGNELAMIENNADFISLITKFEQRPLKLFVYNLEDDACRFVRIIPNSKWGGVGALGCSIGSGFLHQIPLEQNTLSIVNSIVNFIIKTALGVNNQNASSNSYNVLPPPAEDFNREFQVNSQNVIHVQCTKETQYQRRYR